MIVDLVVTDLVVIPELNAVNLTITPTFTSGGGGGTGDVTKAYVDFQDALKVDKVTGKSLVLDTEITKLGTVQANAQPNAAGTVVDANYAADKLRLANTSGTNTGDQTIPTKVSDLTNDSGFITGFTETDPTVPAWAKTPTKPDYTAIEVGAEPANSNIQLHIPSTNNPHNVTKSQVGLGNVDDTSDANKPISTAAQTALDLKIPTSQNQLTKDPTGFHEPSLVVVTGDSATRTITLSGTVAASYRGALVPEIVTGWVSPAHGTDITKKYFLSHNGTAATWSETLWQFDTAQIAIAKYDVVNVAWKYYRETHGLMSWQTHKELHDSVGTYREKVGGDFSDYTLNATTDAARRPQISSFIINDEDLPTTIAALTNKQYTQFNLTGASIENTVIPVAANDIVRLVGNVPQYNFFTGGNWTNAAMQTNTVATIWVYAQPMAADAFSQKHRLLFVQPQWYTQATAASAGAINTAIATEKLRNSAELNLNGLIAEEIVCIAKIIIDYTASNWRLRDVTAIFGSKIAQGNAPAGNGLSAVETDFTLAGNGTATTPLGLSFAIDEVAATLVATSYTLVNNKPLNITGVLPNGVNTTFVLPTPVQGKINQCEIYFKTNGTAAPTFVYSGFTPLWLNGSAISMAINKYYTLIFEQVWNGTAWVVKTSYGPY